VPLRAGARDLTLKTRKPDAGTGRAGQADPGEGAADEGAERGDVRPADPGLAESPDEVSVPLQAVRIGDLGVAAIPFEVFTQTGLDIKARSPFKPTFTVAGQRQLRLPADARAAPARRVRDVLGTNRVEEQASVKSPTR
jgi:hypothetical protein